MLRRTLLLLFTVGALLSACMPAAPSATPTPATQTLIFRNWEGNISDQIFDQFTQQTGIRVVQEPYESQEQAIQELRDGKMCDVLVVENQLIPPLLQDNLLAKINYKDISNFKNISANFRDLAYDPQNAHSVPYSWGTTGIVYRTDLVNRPITSWSDLWDPAFKGKVMGWTLERYMIGLTLKSLGYALNSEDPQQLEAALQKLLELKPGLQLVDWETAVAAPYLVSGEKWLAVGQADDVLEAQKQGTPVAYVLPKDGGLLWGDNFTIPSASPNQVAAQKLINFLLSPEISARIINETYYWLPNDAALPLVKPDIRDNPAIFPTTDGLRSAEILLPLSAEGENLYANIWQRFLDSK